jgi:predicted outer membrane repeat protein
MDDAHFDRLARAWSAGVPRRGLLSLLPALPLFSGLVNAAEPNDVEDAGGRRKRRKKDHKHGKGRRRKGQNKKPKLCRPEPRATTCADTCGDVKNNCQQMIACGSCACEPPCAICQTCQEAPHIPGECVPDPHLVGETCGAGRFCREDGACSCAADSCAACETCQEDGVCSPPCNGEGCCAGDQCEPGDTLGACGIDGASCQVCAEGELCWHGRCVCGDVCADGCQFATLSEAMEAVEVEPGATLRLCAETYAGGWIRRDLTLLGVGDGEDGTVLDAQGRSTTVFTSRDTVVTLQGLRITGGAQLLDTFDGGGISNLGTLTLIDCTVTGNRANGDGGGIYNRGETITLRNTRVTNNRAGIGGGGIYGAKYILQDCLVSGNRAGGRGGGIFAEGGGTIELVNTEVVDNFTDRNHGGGIHCSAVLRLANCRVHGNTATDRGGGIHNDGGELTLEQSQVTDNEAADGGGIYFKIYPQAGSVTLTDSTIDDNEPGNCAGEPIAGCSG